MQPPRMHTVSVYARPCMYYDPGQGGYGSDGSPYELGWEEAARRWEVAEDVFRT